MAKCFQRILFFWCLSNLIENGYDAVPCRAVPFDTPRHIEVLCCDLYCSVMYFKYLLSVVYTELAQLLLLDALLFNFSLL